MNQIHFVRVDEIKFGTPVLRELKDDKEMEELISSIAQHGILQPIILNKQGPELYLVAGQRRLHAARTLHMQEIPAFIVQISDEDAGIIRLHENLFRQELGAVSEAQALLYLEQHYHITREKIATLLGKTKGWVTQRIDILSWPEDLKAALTLKLISFSVGREIAKVDDPEELKRLLDTAIESGATVRVISTWVGEYQQKKVQQKGQITEKEKDEVYRFFIEAKTGPCHTCQNPNPANLHLIAVCDECYTALTSPAPGPEQKKSDEGADKVT